MNDLRLLARQIRYENRAFWRNPAAAFFTFAFPLIFMVIFSVIFGNRDVGPGQSAASFYTPAIIAFSIITACYTNLAMSVTTIREEGILKRVHGTPLPTWVYLCARVGESILVGLILVVIVMVFGDIVYGVALPLDQAPLLLLVLLLGCAAFCALGLAVSGLVPNANAAPAVVNATVLPLLFISDVFVPIDRGSFLAQIAGIFPVRHFADALQAVFTPSVNGTVSATDLAWIVAWAVLGMVLALRTFTWEPRG